MEASQFRPLTIEELYFSSVPSKINTHPLQEIKISLNHDGTANPIPITRSDISNPALINPNPWTSIEKFFNNNKEIIFLIGLLIVIILINIWQVVT